MLKDCFLILGVITIIRHKIKMQIYFTQLARLRCQYMICTILYNIELKKKTSFSQLQSKYVSFQLPILRSLKH